MEITKIGMFTLAVMISTCFLIGSVHGGSYDSNYVWKQMVDDYGDNLNFTAFINVQNFAYSEKLLIWNISDTNYDLAVSVESNNVTHFKFYVTSSAHFREVTYDGGFGSWYNLTYVLGVTGYTWYGGDFQINGTTLFNNGDSAPLGGSIPVEYGSINGSSAYGTFGIYFDDIRYYIDVGGYAIEYVEDWESGWPNGWNVVGSPALSTALYVSPSHSMEVGTFVSAPAGSSAINEGWYNFGIGLLGFILIFSSWFVAKHLYDNGTYAEAVGYWLIMIIFGFGLITVMVGG